MKNHFKAVTFFFRNLEPTHSLRRLMLSILLFIVDLTFGKILNIWDGTSHSRRITHIAIAHGLKTAFNL